MYLDHDAFQPPSDLDGTIWHFCPFESLASILLKQQLFFKRLDRMEDLYEGSHTDATIALLRAPELGWIPGSDRKAIATAKRARKTIAVNCWHMNDFESAAMWDLYAGRNAGIAIRSTYARLKECFKLSLSRLEQGLPGWFVHIGCVEYLNFDVEKRLPINVYRPALSKRKSFEHERELRAIVSSVSHWNGRGNGPKLLADPGEYVDISLRILVESVVVSPLAPKWLVDTTNLLLERIGLGLTASQSTLFSGPI
jgi:hypothetical protein